MVISLACPVCNPHSTNAPSRRDWGCQNTCLDVPLAYVYRSFLSREQMRLALSKLEKNLLRLHSLVGSKIRLAGRELLYVLNNCWRLISQLGAHYTVRLVGIGGREFSVGRLAGYRILFAESALAALRLGQRMNFKMQTNGKHGKPHPKYTTKFTAARRPRPARDGARRNTFHALAHTRPLP